jgi:hypothetical protein
MFRLIMSQRGSTAGPAAKEHAGLSAVLICDSAGQLGAKAQMAFRFFKRSSYKISNEAHYYQSRASRPAGYLGPRGLLTSLGGELGDPLRADS